MYKSSLLTTGHRQFLRFFIIGGTSFILDVSITAVFVRFSGQPIYSGIGGFCIAAVYNFLLNRWWTFRSTNPDVAGEGARFGVVALTSSALNLGIFSAITHFSKIWLLGKCVAAGSVMLFNFFMHKHWTFKKTENGDVRTQN